MVVKEDGAVENGDTVKLDFEGFVDGEAFEGGKAEQYDLEIGSGSFIPGFRRANGWYETRRRKRRRSEHSLKNTMQQNLLVNQQYSK